MPSASRGVCCRTGGAGSSGRFLFSMLHLFRIKLLCSPPESKILPFFPCISRGRSYVAKCPFSDFLLSNNCMPIWGKWGVPEAAFRDKMILYSAPCHPSPFSYFWRSVKSRGGRRARTLSYPSELYVTRSRPFLGLSVTLCQLCRAHSVEGNTKMQSISHPMDLKSQLLSFRSQSQF